MSYRDNERIPRHDVAIEVNNTKDEAALEKTVSCNTDPTDCNSTTKITARPDTKADTTIDKTVSCIGNIEKYIYS